MSHGIFTLLHSVALIYFPGDVRQCHALLNPYGQAQDQHNHASLPGNGRAGKREIYQVLDQRTTESRP